MATQVGQSRERPGAFRALVQMRTDSLGFDRPDCIAHVAAGPLPGPLAVGIGSAALDQLLQPGTAQTLPSPLGEGRGGVGAEPELSTDFSSLAALDVHLPQDLAPAFREGGVCLGDHRVLDQQIGEAIRLRPGGPLQGQFQVILRCRLLPLAGGHGDCDVAHGGAQIGPEGGFGPATGPERGPDSSEGFGHDILGIDAATRSRGHPQRHLPVVEGQLTKGVRIPLTTALEKLLLVPGSAIGRCGIERTTHLHNRTPQPDVGAASAPQTPCKSASSPLRGCTDRAWGRRRISDRVIQFTRDFTLTAVSAASPAGPFRRIARVAS